MFFGVFDVERLLSSGPFKVGSLVSIAACPVTCIRSC